MVDIVKDIKVGEQQSFLGYSKGYTATEGRGVAANDGTAGILNGLANIIPTVAAAGDKIVKESIDEDIYKRNDELNTEFGAEATVNLLSDNQPIPSEISDAETYLTRLKKSAEKGKITANSLNTKVDSLARTLRSKYGSQPYLRDYIDGKISQVTGIPPQNAVRKQLMADYEELAKNSADAMTWDRKQALQLAEQFQNKYGNLEAVVPGWQNKSYTELISSIGPMVKNAYDIDMRGKQMDLYSKENKLTEEVTVQNLNQDLQAMAEDQLNLVNSKTPGTAREIEEELTRLNLLGPTASAEEKVKLQQKTDQWVAGVRSQLLAKINGNPHYAKLSLTAQGMNDLLARPMAAVNAFAENVKNSNVSGIETMKNLVEMNKSRADLKILEHPIHGDLAAYNRNVGGQAASERFKILLEKSRDNPVKAKMFMDMWTNTAFKGGSLGDALNSARVDGFSSTKDLQTLAEQLVSQLGAKGPTEYNTNAAKSLYGPGAKSIMAQLPSAAAKDKIYSTLTSPKALEAVKALKAQGDTEVMNDFYNYATEEFGVIFRESVMAIQGDPSNVTTFDPKTKKFAVEVPVTRTKALTGTNSASPAVIAAKRLNSALDNLMPIVKESGLDPDAFIAPYLEGLGVSPEIIMGKVGLGDVGMGGSNDAGTPNTYFSDTLVDPTARKESPGRKAERLTLNREIAKGTVYLDKDPATGKKVIRLRPGAELYARPGGRLGRKIVVPATQMTAAEGDALEWGELQEYADQGNNILDASLVDKLNTFEAASEEEKTIVEKVRRFLLEAIGKPEEKPYVVNPSTTVEVLKGEDRVFNMSPTSRVSQQIPKGIPNKR